MKKTAHLKDYRVIFEGNLDIVEDVLDFTWECKLRRTSIIIGSMWVVGLIPDELYYVNNDIVSSTILSKKERTESISRMLIAYIDKECAEND